MQQSPPPYALLNFDPTWPRWADVNHWHVVEDWEAYAAACPSKLIGIKINEGLSAATFGQGMLKQAERHGLQVVGYAFGPSNPKTFLQLFPPSPGRIPCLDYEGPSANVRAAEHWISVVASVYGRYPMVYSNSFAFAKPTDPVGEGSVIRHCSWWGASYGNLIRIPRIFHKAVAWQYTDGVNGPANTSRIFAGIGECDQSALLVPVEDL